MQEAQDIFGVDFDYDEFGKYGEEDYEEEEEDEEDEYVDDDGDGERPRRPKKQPRKKPTRKSIFEIYEPSELKRGHFTDMDNEVSSMLSELELSKRGSRRQISTSTLFFSSIGFEVSAQAEK